MRTFVIWVLTLGLLLTVASGNSCGWKFTNDPSPAPSVK